MSPRAYLAQCSSRYGRMYISDEQTGILSTGIKFFYDYCSWRIGHVLLNRDITNQYLTKVWTQAGAELGQAQPELGLKVWV